MESNNKKFYTLCWLGPQILNVQQGKELNEGDTIKHVLYFDDDDEDTDNCFKCLQLISNENVLFVISNMSNNKIVLDEKIFIQVHNLHQVKSIHIDSKHCNRYPPQRFPKVKYVSIETVSHYIEADLHAHSQLTEPFVFNTFDERSSLTMNGDFIHFEMLIGCFVGDHFPSKFLDNYSTFEKGKNEFIEACNEEYKNDAWALKKIKEFEDTYTPKQALNWYTQSSLFYILLNRALRTNDARLILIFRFFIIDLYNQLVEQCCKPLNENNERNLLSTNYVYRGQRMAKHELNGLRKSLGNIISMKSFLSTSLNREFALFCLGDSDDPNQPSLIRVLIEIDLGISNSADDDEKPFANITEHSLFGETEKEVLFMVGSFFRVVEVRRGEKGIWYVRLATLGPFENPLRFQSKWGGLYGHMQRNCVHPAVIAPTDIGAILFQSGKFDQAQTYYKRLIQHLRKLVYIPEEIEDEEDEYEPPSRTHNRSGGLANLFKDLVSNVDDHDHFEYTKGDHILICYYVLGRITHEKDQFDLSLVYYEAVLTQTSPSFLMHEPIGASRIHFLRALCRLGLGRTYELSGQLKRACELYTKALRMFEQAHDGYVDKFPGDSNLSYVYKAHCLIGLGNLLLIEQKFERADKHYREALLLFDRYLPVGHPDQSRTRQKMANIIRIYRCKPDMALEDYEDCLENYLRSLPSDHVDIARVYADMACSYEQLPNELGKALNYARKAADIFEKALPEEHTDNVTIDIIIKRIRRKLSLEK